MELTKFLLKIEPHVSVHQHAKTETKSLVILLTAINAFHAELAHSQINTEEHAELEILVVAPRNVQLMDSHVITAHQDTLHLLTDPHAHHKFAQTKTQ